MFISPISSYNYNCAYSKKTKLNNNTNPVFKQNKDVIISRNSMKIVDSIFSKMIEAKEELRNMVINKNGFEVRYKTQHAINPEMRRYNKETDTLLRLEESVNGTALGVNIDRFRDDEKLRFLVQMEDLKDMNNNILLRRGTVSEFNWIDNFKNRSDEIDKIDYLIETYLK